MGLRARAALATSAMASGWPSISSASAMGASFRRRFYHAWAELGSAERSPSREGAGTLSGFPI